MSKLIIINNKKCQIVSDNDSLIKKLRSFLSYKAIGVEYSAAYQNGWSGITYLINKNNIFGLGLLSKVKEFLTKNNEAFTVEDKRKPKQIVSELDLNDRLSKLGLTPREHQLKILKLTEEYDRGIVRAATGSGKTLCIALMTAKLNKPTIVYVIGLDLLDQFHNLFSKIFDEKIGYIGNGICDPQRITIASIWTVGRALNLDVKSILTEGVDEEDPEEQSSEINAVKIVKCLNNAKVHFLDESHVCSTSTISAIYKNIDPEYLFGFSGTPFRDDNSDLLINSILGEQIINISASELIAKGLLAQPIIKFVPVPKMSGLSNNYQSVYKDYIVENDERNNLIIEELKGLLQKKYVPLVLFKQIKHGKILAEKMEEENIKFAMLYGNDSLEKRNEAKEALNKKEIDVILASVVFDIGLDLPILSSLVLCGGGKSSIRSLQRVGRVIRPVPGKKFAAIVDFYDQVRFLKGHSVRRYEVYSSEEGFKVFKCKEMK